MDEGTLLWTPPPDLVAHSNLSKFMAWLADQGLPFADYEALWAWSVDQMDVFWAKIWEYYDIISDDGYDFIRTGATMEETNWFVGARLNFAEHALRMEANRPDGVALHHESEIRPVATISWAGLGQQVRTLATAMRGLGIVPGDRVASCLPNIAEAVIAMLATASVGAIWSSVAPEFGVRTVVDRFGQIAPKLFFTVDGYRYGGKDRPLNEASTQIVAALPSLEHVVTLRYLDRSALPVAHAGACDWDDLMVGPAPNRDAFSFTRVEHDHPLWILFSSGTTGLPKAIVHGHIGITLETLKAQHLSAEFSPDSTLFFYSTTGWVVWNTMVSALVTGTALVLYDGHPFYPQDDLVWRIAEKTSATAIGLSPGLVARHELAGLVPAGRFDLSALKHVILGGAPASPETFHWCYENIKRDLWVVSQAGSTEICSSLVGGIVSRPVYAGEIQGRMLGIAIDCFSDDGRPIRNATGELVVTAPFPSMPLALWNDPKGERFHEAYFSHFKGIWRQGDLFQINDRGGSFIYGRSDATMNRFGVRIGTAEIYRTLANVPQVTDSIVVCMDAEHSAMLLFVMLAPGFELDGALRAHIARVLQQENSARHIPDEILSVPAIPYTASGKRMEVPLKRVLSGATPQSSANPDTMADPQALDWFENFSLARKMRFGGSMMGVMAG
jgi:acetoacetyl-CoA synthetase